MSYASRRGMIHNTWLPNQSESVEYPTAFMTKRLSATVTGYGLEPLRKEHCNPHPDALVASKNPVLFCTGVSNSCALDTHRLSSSHQLHNPSMQLPHLCPKVLYQRLCLSQLISCLTVLVDSIETLTIYKSPLLRLAEPVSCAEKFLKHRHETDWKAWPYMNYTWGWDICWIVVFLQIWIELQMIANRMIKDIILIVLLLIRAPINTTVSSNTTQHNTTFRVYRRRDCTHG